MKNLIVTAAKFLLSGFILYMLFRSMNTEDLYQTAVSVHPLSVIAVALMFASVQAISAYRWRAILAKDVDLPYRRLLSIYFIGMFFNNFMPTIVGGDIIKGYYLYKHTGRGDISLASIFMDRYSGLTALVIMTTIALILGWGLLEGTGLHSLLILVIAGYTGISLVLWIEYLHRWAMRALARIHFYGINNKIDTVYKTLMSYRSHRGILIKIFICSAVIQPGTIIGYYVLSRGLGMTVPIGYFFLFIPLATIVAMLPISLAGLGIREGAFVFLFSKAGASTEQALTLSLIWFATMVAVSLIGGVEYLRAGGRKNTRPPTADQP